MGLDHVVRKGLKHIGIKSKTVHRGVKWLLNPTRAATASHRGSAFRSILTGGLGTIESGKHIKAYNKVMSKLASRWVHGGTNSAATKAYSAQSRPQQRVNYSYRKLSEIM